MFTAKIKIMTEALFQDLFKRQKESGLTVRDFCANEGILYVLYLYDKELPLTAASMYPSGELHLS